MTEHPSTRPDDARRHDSPTEPTAAAGPADRETSAPDTGLQTEGRPGSPRDAAPARPVGSARPAGSTRPVRLTDDEASGTAAGSAAPVASGRYDTRRGISRTTQVRLAVAAVTVAVLSIAWVTMGPTASTVRGKDFGYSVKGPEAVDITFDVAKPEDSTVVCTVEALNENYAQVGTKEVTIGPAEVSEARYTTTIATTELAVTAVVDECVLVD
ncbi:DUF4307 domain-containing protein [Sanguibacter sp. 4.1]|uniref:DUF4307 domain-containing protein n=1 Tax=Sanguibacter biliveldensis TaxID=3030830 RepID=A0AAF0Z517_9MICO|nr:DUF4307 domain-containing protein [Sanguibacter sp. 4.1]WPF83153.1 DUF4307 domain-containing protein [Sanguibacter sp. 4.1]